MNQVDDSKAMDNIKSMIIWAKEQKIKHIQIGEIVCVFHDDAFKSMVFADKPEPKTAEEIAKEEEAILYHSSN